LIPPPPPPSVACIESKLNHNNLAAFEKYVISAFPLRPNTSGVLIIGISYIAVKNPSKFII